jgi:hypothetical protein
MTEKQARELAESILNPHEAMLYSLEELMIANLTKAILNGKLCKPLTEEEILECMEKYQEENLDKTSCIFLEEYAQALSKRIKGE